MTDDAPDEDDLTDLARVYADDDVEPVVKVTDGSDGAASTDGETVHLSPDRIIDGLPEDADTTQHVANVLAHEVEHMNRTDFGTMERFVTECTDAPNVAGAVVNVVEDAYIDHHRLREYPGFRRTEQELTDAALADDDLRPPVDTLDDETALVESLIQLGGSGQVKGREGLSDDLAETVDWIETKLEEVTDAHHPDERDHIAADILAQLLDYVEAHDDASMDGADEAAEERRDDLGAESLDDAVEQAEEMADAEPVGTGEQVGDEPGGREMDGEAESGTGDGDTQEPDEVTEDEGPDGLLSRLSDALEGLAQSVPTTDPADSADDGGEPEDTESDDDPDEMDDTWGSDDSGPYQPLDGVGVTVGGTSDDAPPNMGFDPEDALLDPDAFSPTPDPTDDDRPPVTPNTDADEVVEAVEDSGLADEIEAAFRQLKTRDTEQRSRSGQRVNTRAAIRRAAGDRGEKQLYYRRQTAAVGDRAVGVALDCSDSMNMAAAKQALLALSIATDSIGDELVASGFQRATADTTTITGPSEPFTPDDMDAVEGDGGTPTADGIESTADLLAGSPRRESVLIVITDGKANVELGGIQDMAMDGMARMVIGNGENEQAIDDATEAVRKHRRQGTRVIGLSVGDSDGDHYDDHMRHLFGEDGYVRTDFDNLADKLVEVYRRQIDVGGVVV